MATVTKIAPTGALRDISMASDPATEDFVQLRPRLWGIAYRMLGSVADAEDALQDTYLKWRRADHARIETPEAWLVAVCTRRCIDLLRGAHKARVDYVGLWLPEPVQGDLEPTPSDHVELASSLTTAFLLLLERLTPLERAAYLLRDVFDYDYQDLARVLDRSEAAIRQIVSRARQRLSDRQARTPLPFARQEALLENFLDALKTGRTDRLQTVLAEDVEFWGDGGGKVPAGGLEVMRSAAEVATFLAHLWEHHWQAYDLVRTRVNGAPGLILRQGHQVVAVVSLLWRDGQCAGIFVVRNPDKLVHIASAEADETPFDQTREDPWHAM